MSDSIDEIPGVTLTPTPNDAALTPNDVDLGLFLSGLTGDPAGPDLAQITVPALLGPPQPLPLPGVTDPQNPSGTPSPPGGNLWFPGGGGGGGPIMSPSQPLTATPATPADSIINGDPNGGDTFFLTSGNTDLTVHGVSNTVILDGGTAIIDDQSQGLQIALDAPVTGTDYIIGVLSDPTLQIALSPAATNFNGGPENIAPMFSSDGNGGTLMTLFNGGKIDFVGMYVGNIPGGLLYFP